MPAWLIPYWIADVLVTLGLVLMGLGSAGVASHLARLGGGRRLVLIEVLALIWLRTRLGGGRG